MREEEKLYYLFGDHLGSTSLTTDASGNLTAETALASELADVKNSVETINTKLSKIENLIALNPQNALEIPLLRKDLDKPYCNERYPNSGVASRC